MQKRNKNHGSRANGNPAASGKQIEVVFALEHPEANEVYLCGDFNQWSATNLPMIRRSDRHWEKKVVLPPGRYEYKLIVDGKWTPDPGGQREVHNVFGTTNSVVEIC